MNLLQLLWLMFFFCFCFGIFIWAEDLPDDLPDESSERLRREWKSRCKTMIPRKRDGRRMQKPRKPPRDAVELIDKLLSGYYRMLILYI